MQYISLIEPEVIINEEKNSQFIKTKRLFAGNSVFIRDQSFLKLTATLASQLGYPATLGTLQSLADDFRPFCKGHQLST